MRKIALLASVTTLVVMLAFIPRSSGLSDAQSAPIFGIKLPADYRDWKLISVAHEEGTLNDFRAVLGNDVAVKAFRDDKELPDGAIIARLAWKYVSSEENNKAFGRSQSFVAGPPINVQLMVRDSQKYSATGGWGFAQFTDAKPDDEAVHKTCFPCHAKTNRIVFTHYSR